MLHVSACVTTANASLLGWRYFWAKRVDAFRADVHCARCLVGSYVKPIGTKMPVNEEVGLPGFMVGDILYVCGVSAPYRWERNLHLAVRVTGDRSDVASVDAYTRDTLTIFGATALPFDDKAALASHPHRGKEFLTCRNFQFGAAMVRAGLLKEAQHRFAHDRQRPLLEL